MDEHYNNIAVLIDADNTQIGMIKTILDESAKHGRIVVKEAFGDWSNSTLKGWEAVIKDAGIHPIQQFAYTKQKNATDMELVISAMDLLASDKYDLFVIVSSDSDFTPLAIRLKESGAEVFGFGEEKTPNPFVQSCDHFFYLEDLGNEDTESERKIKETDKVNKEDPKVEAVIAKLLSLSKSHENDEGWVAGSEAGNYLQQTDPSFSLKTLGYSKLSDFIQKYDKQFESVFRKQPDAVNPLFFFRAKNS